MKMFTLKTVAVANDGCPAIKEAMTKSPVTVSGNETVAEALYKMNQKNVLRLPVVTESGSVAGIIAKSDIKAKQAELDSAYYSGTTKGQQTQAQSNAITAAQEAKSAAQAEAARKKKIDNFWTSFSEVINNSATPGWYGGV